MADAVLAVAGGLALVGVSLASAEIWWHAVLRPRIRRQQRQWEKEMEKKNEAPKPETTESTA
jgi:hypothetical protein